MWCLRREHKIFMACGGKTARAKLETSKHTPKVRQKESPTPTPQWQEWSARRIVDPTSHSIQGPFFLCIIGKTHILGEITHEISRIAHICPRTFYCYTLPGNFSRLECIGRRIPGPSHIISEPLFVYKSGKVHILGEITRDISRTVHIFSWTFNRYTMSWNFRFVTVDNPPFPLACVRHMAFKWWNYIFISFSESRFSFTLNCCEKG